LKSKTTVILLILLILSSACAHKIDVQQGNVLTKEKLAKLKVGMNELQVKSVMGTPLVIDPFHKNRWDYVYSMKLGDSGKSQYSYVSLFFKDRVLTNIDVHVKPLPEKQLIVPALVSEGRS
jgi:outer membrane protein assembly factor BamE